MATEEQKVEYVDLLKKMVEVRGLTLPEGFDSWGIKTVGFDRRTQNGFLWGGPGTVTERYELDPDNAGSCPIREGDGLCVGLDWRGMASAGKPALCLLVVAYRESEAKSDEAGKLRVPQVAIVDAVDSAEFVRKYGTQANLYGANLRGANLYGADLYGADRDYAKENGAIVD